MPNVGPGPVPKKRSWFLLEALLRQADEEAWGKCSAFQGIKIKTINWDTKKNPQLEVKNATKESLMALIEKWLSDEIVKDFLKKNYKFTSQDVRDTLNISLKINLNRRCPLPILENLDKEKNIQGVKNSEIRNFRLHLWGITLEENREGFEQNWCNPTFKITDIPPPTNDNKDINFESFDGKTDKFFQRQYQNPSQYIPYKGVNNFVGRQQELERLHQALQSNQRVAVVGLAGVGKSELVIRYARDNEANYQGGMCWFNLRELTLAPQLLQFAQLYLNLEVPQQTQGIQLNVEQQVEWCWQHWKPSEGNVLVVLDDVTDFASCIKLLPKANRFRVLLTSRLRNLDPMYVEEITLDILSIDEALQLFTNTLRKTDKRVKWELQTAQELCEWLGCLPLGLLLVGQYLSKKPNWSLAKILQRLKEQKLENEAINTSEQQLQSTLSTVQRGVQAAFELSWKELDPITQNIAKYLSLFAHTDFLWEWIELANKLSWNRQQWVSVNQNSDSFLPYTFFYELVKANNIHICFTEFEIEKANEQLYEYYFIQPVGERIGCYKIHSLVREFLQAKLANSEQKHIIKYSFLKTMIEVAMDITELSNTNELRALTKICYPHVMEAMEILFHFMSSHYSCVPEMMYFHRQLTSFYRNYMQLPDSKFWDDTIIIIKN